MGKLEGGNRAIESAGQWKMTTCVLDAPLINYNRLKGECLGVVEEEEEEEAVAEHWQHFQW